MVSFGKAEVIVFLYEKGAMMSVFVFIKRNTESYILLLLILI